MKLIFVDTETTSVKDDARLVQLAYTIEDMPSIESSLFRPPTPISYSAMSVHGITNDDVTELPSFAGSQNATTFITELSSRIFVSHNAPFDIMVLGHEGVTVGWSICTLAVATWVLPEAESYGLHPLRYQFDLEAGAGRAHDAAFDVAVLKELFYYLLTRIKDTKPAITEKEALFEMVKLTRRGRLLRTCYFKPHKGVPWEQLAKIEPSFCRWVISRGFDDETISSVRYWLEKARG